MFWAIKFSIKDAPWATTISIFLRIIDDLKGLFFSFLYALIFNQVAPLILQKVDYQTAIHNLFPYFMIWLAANIVTSILVTLRYTLENNLDTKRRTYFEKMFLTKMAQIDFQQHDSADINDKIKKAEDNIWKVNGIYRDVIRYISQLVSGITSLVILLRYYPLLVLLAIVFVAPFVVKDIMYNREMRKIYDDAAEIWRRYWHGRWFLTDKNSLNELKLHNSNNRLFKMIFGIRDDLDGKAVNTNNKYAKFDIVASVAQVYSTIGTILVVIKVITTGGTIGDVSFYMDRVSAADRFINSVIRDFISLYDQTKYLKYVKDFFEIRPIIENGKKKINITAAPTIEFKDVFFKYPNTDKYVLKNINLTIKPGEEIAIVGENGAGKSTLIKLLLRQYDPTKGDIFINGINLKEIDINSYHNAIGSLMQEYNYPGFLSVRDNIEFLRSKYSVLKTSKAAALADIEKTIKKFKNGYNQLCSRSFEGGTELSYGQSQKLVIARVFYRNAPVLILDEPTASIDALAEAKIFNRIYNFMKNKTVIIISHRFSTVRNAKKIYVIHSGRIVEGGTHQELLALNKMYAKSFNTQAEGYLKKD